MHWISTYACISIVWKVSRNYVQTIQAVVGFVRTFKMQKHLQLFVLGLWHSYREVVFDLYLQNTFAFCTSNHLTFALCTSTHLTLTFWSINNRMSGKLSTCRVDLSLTCIWAVLVQTWVVFELYKHDLYLWCTNTKKSLKLRCIYLTRTWVELYFGGKGLWDRPLGFTAPQSVDLWDSLYWKWKYRVSELSWVVSYSKLVLIELSQIVHLYWFKLS